MTKRFLENIGPLSIDSTKALEQVRRFDFAEIIAAGPLTKQPASLALRVVLFMDHAVEGDAGQLVVWNQLFPNFLANTESYFQSGEYFRINELHLATKAFARRLDGDAESMASLYRED